MRLLAVVALLMLAALYLLVANPIPPRPATQPLPAPAATPAAVAEPAVPTEQVRTKTPDPAPAASTGEAARAGPTTGSPACAPSALTIPDLGVNAGVVTIGLDSEGNLGAPSDSDKTRAGWFPSVLAGAARGSVILSGHTYHDESAIFKTDFNQKAHVGMTVQLSCVGTAPHSYRVTEAKLDLGVESYAAYVDSRRLYATDGPPRVVIITCTSWNPVRRDYDQRGVLIATPV